MIETPGPLVSPEWLVEHFGEEGLVVADVRWVPDGSGPQAFAEGHIAGAVYLDVDADLAAPPAKPGGRHPLPAPAAFAAAMSRAGIGDDDLVVACDTANGSHAVRLWWMLAVTGHNAAVLDGGLPAWEGATETGEPRRRRSASFTPRPWPDAAMASAEEVEDAIRAGASVLDARARERYRGDVEPFDPRAGHIPGARNAPWSDNIDPATGRFLPPDVLAQRYRDAGVTTIVHCGSGVTGPHDALAMRLAGLPMPRLYVGSWSDWVSDPDRPVATGDEP